MTMSLRRTRTCPRTCPGLETGPAQEVFFLMGAVGAAIRVRPPMADVPGMSGPLQSAGHFGHFGHFWLWRNRVNNWLELGQLEALGRSTSHAATLDQTAVQNGGRRVP